jgi:putative serine protease PepD
VISAKPIRAVALVGLLALAGCGGSNSTTSQTVPAPKPAAAAAGDLQAQQIQVVHDVSPAVVQIQTSQGLGSGIVYDAQGHIVTNNHVVGTSRTFQVTLSGGDQHPASLVGTFPASDLAVIKLGSGSPPAARFGNSAKAKVGEFALAIGNPLGLRSSVTQGIVSSLGRTVSEGNGVTISSAIQTSAAINPGNSGGALVDLAGQVIGIPTLAATDPELGGAQAPGIGFAIPSDTVNRVARQLIANGSMSQSGRAFLGVEVATAPGAPGAVVAGVERSGPAAKAGIAPGDVIVSVAGQPTPTADDLTTVLANLKSGQRVPVVVVRPNGTRKTFQVTLGQSPS